MTQSVQAANGAALCFQATTFDVVSRDGQLWLRSPQIAVSLGYSREDRVNELYSRNASEFTASMTAVVKLPTAGGVQDVRIFSLRGAHLLGMFARTPKAAEFRRWVLDVLDAQAQPAPIPLAKLPDLDLTDGPAIPALPVRDTDGPLPRLDPAAWEHRNAGLTIEAAKNVVAALDQWALRLPACGARNDVRDALEHLHRLLVRGWTEVDESLTCLSTALRYLNRWQGHSGRFSSSR